MLYIGRKRIVWKEAKRQIEELKAKGNTVIDEEKTEIDDDSNVKVEEETCFFFNFIRLLTRKEKFIKD